MPTDDNSFHATYITISWGIRNTPFFDTEKSVDIDRLNQHGRRVPFFILDSATATWFVRVSGLLVARIQRSQSQRAIGVISRQTALAVGSAARAAVRSAGRSGSGQSLLGTSSTRTLSPVRALEPTSSALSSFSQWLPVPSGSSGVRN